MLHWMTLVLYCWWVALLTSVSDRGTDNETIAEQPIAQAARSQTPGPEQQPMVRVETMARLAGIRHPVDGVRRRPVRRRLFEGAGRGGQRGGVQLRGVRQDRAALLLYQGHPGAQG